MQKLARARRGLIAALAALVALPALPRDAAAHAIVTESTPAAGATVKGPELAVSVHFNSRIDAARSRLILLHAGEKDVELAIAPATAPDLLSATASGLRPGKYRLRWQVLAVDGHITRGDIPFTVAP